MGVAFWKDIRVRPFGADGLAGSSRPLPDPAALLKVGPNTYTWHQTPALPVGEQKLVNLVVPSSIRESPLTEKRGVWVRVGQEADSNGGLGTKATPAYSDCFQF